MRKNLFCFVIFSFLNALSASGQLVDDQFKYYKTLYEIKNNPLIVRLNMKKRTLNAYQKILDKPNLNESERSRTELQLQEIQQNREMYKSVTLEAFSRNFNFSEVLFIENQNFNKFRNGLTGYVFNANNQEVDHNPEHYYLLVQGENDLSWKIVDKDLNDLGSTIFEAGIGFKRFVNWISGEPNSNILDMSNVATKLDTKLHSYFEQRTLDKILPKYFFIPYLY